MVEEGWQRAHTGAMATLPVPYRNLSFPQLRYPLSADERFLSVEEYLTTVYRPDMDYVDGHLEERNLGEFDHADLQSELLAILRNHAREWGIHAVAECRLQVKEDRFRIPDIQILLRAAGKPDRIVRSAPLLCIEVLSSSDTFLRLQSRVDDYVQMGVKHVWLIDPKDTTRVLVVEGGVQRWLEGTTLSVAETAIQVNLRSTLR